MKTFYSAAFKFKALVICFICLWVSQLCANSGHTYKMESSVISNGGNSSGSGDFSLKGTTGQPVVGNSDAGEFEVRSGFWPAVNNDIIFRNGFE